MSSAVDFVEPDTSEISLNSSEIIDLISNLKKKCNDNNINILDESCIEDGNIDIDLTLKIKSSNYERDIYIFTHDHLEKICNIDFEKYRFIHNYQAIWSKDNCSIEAYINGISPRGALHPAIRILRMLNMSENINGRNFIEYKLKSPECFSSEIIIKIKKPSSEISTLCEIPKDRFLTLEIKNINVDNHDQSLEILHKVSNSLFFEMDINKNISFQLIKSNRFSIRKSRNDNDIPVTFPKNSYDNEPMTLYWYARGAVNMPLLQYLAYYQAIEFYYPIFHNADLSKRIKNILRSPSFRYEKDTDIIKLINALKGKGNGIASEREQLKATLKECIDPDDLKSFINSDEERKTALTRKLNNITSHALQITQNNEGLIANLMERIYSIRCKIVHIKADDKVDDLKLLLPFSKEEDSIQHDIDLIQYVAQKIIVYCSKPLESL